MTLSIRRLHARFVAEVSGVELRARLDDATFAAIRDAFEEHSVLVFHDQRWSDEEQIAFTRRFGPLEETTTSIARNTQVAPQIADLSNVDPEGRMMSAEDRRMLYHKGNQLWHSDSSFKRVPAMASLLSAREVPPEGGETEYASLRAAWAALPRSMQERLDGLVAVHSFAYSRSLIAPGLLLPEQEAALPPVKQALVRANPVNGRKAVYLGSHASHILGMPVEEGRALLRELLEGATRPANVYQHRWRAGDAVMWDNRAVLHRGRPWDTTRYRRVMHRTTIAGDGPTVPEPFAIEEAAVR
ncbi:MAG TPA: TauD/TfdA family dioxygenase [Methylomirabilota bacterium]|jgi:alpha-ketoglutarate-dependent 2,4-dichlorophenoxyacetate dioxygenase